MERFKKDDLFYVFFKSKPFIIAKLEKDATF